MLVVDYKSDRVDEQADLEEIVERDYAIQRQLYALAGFDGSREVQVAHWFLARPAEHAEVRYTPTWRCSRARSLSGSSVRTPAATR